MISFVMATHILVMLVESDFTVLAVTTRTVVFREFVVLYVLSLPLRFTCRMRQCVHRDPRHLTNL